MRSLSSLWRLCLPVAVLVLAACSSTPPPPEPADYPSLPKDALALKRVWKVSVGDGLAEDALRLPPAVGEQRVTAVSRDGVVMSIARDSGKLFWRQETGLPLTAGPGAGYGLIAVGTAKGDVLLLSELDGSQKWKVSVGASVLSAPAVAADTVVVMSTDGVVHALSVQTGESRWTYNTSVPPLSLRANAAPLIAGDRVYVATAAGKLMVFDLASGVAGWEVRVASNNGRTELERMNDIVGDVLVSGSSLYTVGFQSQLTAVDGNAGRRRWQFDVSGVYGAAAALGNIYVTDTEGHVIAVDEGTGKVVWKQSDYRYRHVTGPVVLANIVAVGDDNGRVHLLAQSDGQVRGREKVSGEPLVSLTAAGEQLLAWDVEGHLSAWQLVTP